MNRLYTTLTAYAIGINAGSAYLFYYDKKQAVQGGWRVKESSLQLSALLGGWVGGVWAMKRFRHKTSKIKFQRIYYLATLTNMGLCVGIAHPTSRIYILRTANQVFQNSKNPKLFSKKRKRK
eukprot:gb/GECH01003826.1/.p1 GENE.gb/GECH01003826.1/~~gb/GECH01003826.1/.p1  ORF type:complete len:122 (+),score=19.75 gb/GECH01003826.1/:1-366(+)